MRMEKKRKLKASIEIERDIHKIPTYAKFIRGKRELEVSFRGGKISLEAPRGQLPSLAEMIKMVYPVMSVLTVRGMNWFDRNPTSINDEYAATVGPHAETDRLTYTCPVDTIALVEILNVEVYRITAPAPANTVSGRWKFTPDGGAEQILATAHFLNAAVDTRDRCSLGATMAMVTGDTITGSTVDNSTGGTVNYRLSYKLTEFTI